MVFSPIFYTVINEMTNALISFKPQKVGCYFNFFFLIYYFFSSNICLDLTYGVCGSSLSIFSFFFFFQPQFMIFLQWTVHCSRDPQIPIFSNFFIKNESHSTIHTFKNYFATVFSVFSKNKLYPNVPLENFKILSFFSSTKLRIAYAKF